MQEMGCCELAAAGAWSPAERHLLRVTGRNGLPQERLTTWGLTLTWGWEALG